MMSEGIIDPLKVVRTGLSDAYVALLATTEAMIVDAPVKESESPAGGMNQSMMGGMGGFKLRKLCAF